MPDNSAGAIGLGVAQQLSRAAWIALLCKRWPGIDNATRLTVCGGRL